MRPQAEPDPRRRRAGAPLWPEELPRGRALATVP